MKGTLTIDASKDGVHITGEMAFRELGERYELIRCLCLSLNINSPSEWADLVCYCLPRLTNEGRTSNTIEIRLPTKKENDNETDAH